MLSHWLLATMVSDENRLLIFLRSLCTCHFWCLLGVSAIFWQFYYNMSWCKSLWLYPLSFVVCWASVTYAAAAKSLQSCPTLCNPIDSSPPGSRIPGILQARTLEWVAISFSSGRKWKAKVKSLSCVWLCDPMDRSLPGSSVHGIFQAKVCIDSCFSLNLGSPWPLFLQILFLSLSLLGLPHNEIVNDVSQVPLVLKIFFFILLHRWDNFSCHIFKFADL